MTHLDEEAIARLLRALPPAPRGWVQAAQELPGARHELDEIVELAESDAAFRERLLQDLERALEGKGYRPAPALVRAVRGYLHHGS